MMVNRENTSAYLTFEKPTRDMKISHEPHELYTHPVKELNNGGEPVKNATYWKRQYNLMATQNDNLKSGLYHANEQIKYLEARPVKELTDEEIKSLIPLTDVWWCEVGEDEAIDFAKTILHKAQNK